MSDKRSNEQMDNLRERLYARGETPRQRPRTTLKKERPAAVKSWDTMPPRPPVPPAATPTPEAPTPAWSFRKYRSKLIMLGLAFFAISVVLSSVYILLGRNSVSGSNISIGVTGPFTIGGGEVLPLQVGITNQNNVPIETATLVVEYPPGTRSSEGEGKELFSERVPISSEIAAGETRNVPLRARVFGEENQEEEIRVSIEYRMKGSSATFYKEAEPLRYKISHAPLVIKVDAEKNTSSGQETRALLTITSNSPAPIYDLLVKAEYPSGYEFTRSEPSPQSGRNIWSIKELKPEQSVTIDLYGVITGTESEKRVVKFAVGVSGERNPSELASVLAVTDTEFTLENPFLATNVTVDGKSDETVSIAPGSQTSVVIDVENGSGDVVYDAIVEVKLSGNAFSDTEVLVNTGYYDSNTRTIRFDAGSSPDLRRMDPGESKRFAFSLQPQAAGLQSPQVVLEVSAAARRVSQSSAREEISGTIKRVIKVEGKLALSGAVADVTNGPVPPVAGRTTSYRVALEVENSGNSADGAILTAVLPSYVEWTGDSAGDGNWNYNSSTRTVEWRPGSIERGDTARGTFGVSILPSISLVGTTPPLVRSIELRATDSFTGSTLRATSGEITTQISGQQNSGTVQSN